MAVLLPDDDFYPKREELCFLCSTLAGDGEPVVMWGGQDLTLYLHGGCAGSFVLRIARDAWQVERDADDGKFTLTDRRERD